MPRVELKLKQASVVLGVPPKALQNFVQARVLKPRRRLGLYYFDTSLLKATVALYLKESLGASTSYLTKFADAVAQLPGFETRTPAIVRLRASAWKAIRQSRFGSPWVLWLQNSAAGCRLPMWRETSLPDASVSGGSVSSSPPSVRQRSSGAGSRTGRSRTRFTPIAETGSSRYSPLSQKPRHSRRRGVVIHRGRTGSGRRAILDVRRLGRGRFHRDAQHEGLSAKPPVGKGHRPPRTAAFASSPAANREVSSSAIEDRRP